MTQDRTTLDSSRGSPSSGTSRSLLALVQANDPGAWDRFVHLYAPLVYHWCRCWKLPEEDVADVFQEVFQSVVMHVGRFRKAERGDTLRGWLRRITQNKVRDHFRKRVRETRAAGGSSGQERLAQFPDAAELSDDLSADAGAEEGLFARALELLRGEFEPRTWKAFWRVVVDGRSAQEAAESLSMTPGAVRVAKSRVLRRLREELGDFAE